MTDEYHTKGHCLCQAVTLTVTLSNRNVDACHCHMCRTWGGGPLLALESDAPVEIDGEEHVTVYGSSDWAERGFCRHCGSHLFYRLKEGDHYAIPVGLIDAGEAWTFTSQIFIDEKPSFYDFANETTKMTGKEVFEAFATSSQ